MSTIENLGSILKTELRHIRHQYHVYLKPIAIIQVLFSFLFLGGLTYFFQLILNAYRIQGLTLTTLGVAFRTPSAIFFMGLFLLAILLFFLFESGFFF